MKVVSISDYMIEKLDNFDGETIADRIWDAMQLASKASDYLNCAINERASRINLSRRVATIDPELLGSNYHSEEDAAQARRDLKL